MRIIALLPLLCALLLALGCAPLTPAIYKLDVRQGNLLEQDQVRRLTPGMSKRQVQALIGSPLLTDPFNQQRWDYVYLYYPRGNESQGVRRNLVLYFQGELLERIEGGLDGAP